MKQHLKIFFLFFILSFLTIVFFYYYTLNFSDNFSFSQNNEIQTNQKVGYYPFEGGVEIAPTVPPEEICQVKINEQLYFHPVACISNALVIFNLFLKTNKIEYSKNFIKFADYISQKADYKNNKDILFPYNFEWDYADYHTYKAPWYSGMAQGMASSVFVRAWEISANKKYLNLAYGSLHPLTYNNPYNIAFFEKEKFWIEEYPGFERNKKMYWDHTLNGGLFGAYGFYDYYVATNNQQAKNLFHKAMKTFINQSENYDTGYGPAYSLIDTSHLKKVFYLESAINTNKKLPVYKFEIYDKEGVFLDDFYFDDGCRNYPIKSFNQSQEINLFFKNNDNINNINIPISQIKIIDNNGVLIDNLDSNKINNLKSIFSISIPKLKDADYIKFVVTYQDLQQGSLSLRMDSSCNYSLGTIQLSGDQKWHSQEFRLRKEESVNDQGSAYLGWSDRYELETRYVKDASFEKILDQWNGAWLRFLPHLNNQYINALKKDYFLVRLTYKDTMNETIYLRMWNGDGLILGTLSNTGSGEWKTDEFRVDSRLFKKLVSPEEKVLWVEQAYLNYDKLFDCPQCRYWIEKWKQEQHYTFDSLTFMFSADPKNTQTIDFEISNLKICGSKQNPVNCTIQHNRFFIPSQFKKNIEVNQQNKLHISLEPNQFILINVPHFFDNTIQKYYRLGFNLSYKNTGKGTVYLNGIGEVFQSLFRLDQYLFQGIENQYKVDLTMTTDKRGLTIIEK